MLIKPVMLQSSYGALKGLLAGLDPMGFSTILHLCAISFNRLSASTGTTERSNAPNFVVNKRNCVRLASAVALDGRAEELRRLVALYRLSISEGVGSELARKHLGEIAKVELELAKIKKDSQKPC